MYILLLCRYWSLRKHGWAKPLPGQRLRELAEGRPVADLYSRRHLCLLWCRDQKLPPSAAPEIPTPAVRWTLSVRNSLKTFVVLFRSLFWFTPFTTSKYLYTNIHHCLYHYANWSDWLWECVWFEINMYRQITHFYFMFCIRSMMLHVLQWSSTKASIYNTCDREFMLIMSYIQHPTIMALRYYNMTCSVDHDIDVRSIHTQHIYFPGSKVCAHLVSHGIRSGNKIFSPSSLPAQTLVRQTLASLSGRGRHGRLPKYWWGPLTSRSEPEEGTPSRWYSWWPTVDCLPPPSPTDSRLLM